MTHSSLGCYQPLIIFQSLTKLVVRVLYLFLKVSRGTRLKRLGSSSSSSEVLSWEKRGYGINDNARPHCQTPPTIFPGSERRLSPSRVACLAQELCQKEKLCHPWAWPCVYVGVQEEGTAPQCTVVGLPVLVFKGISLPSPSGTLHTTHLHSSHLG